MEEALTTVETVAGRFAAGSRAHTIGSRLAQNAAATFAGQVVTTALTLVATPYITRKLGPNGYGALSLLMAYLFSFSLLNLGLNASVVKYIAELLPQGRAAEVQSYFSTSFTLLVGIGGVAGVLVYGLAEQIVGHFFKDGGSSTYSTILALRIASAAFVLQFLCQAFSAVPAAAQRFELLSLVRTGSEAFRILGTVGLLWLGRGLPTLMVVVVFAFGLSAIGYAAAAKRLLPKLRVKPGYSVKHALLLLRHSRFVVVVNASNQLVTVADSFLIGMFLPVANVAYYTVAYVLASRMWAFVANVASVVFPAASAFSGTHDHRRFNELYVRSMKAAAIAGGFPAAALCFLGRPFLKLWLSPDYADKGAPVLALVSVGFFLSSFSMVAYQVLQSTHRVSFAAKASLLYTIPNLAGFLVFIPRFGIIGAGGAFLGSQILFVPWFVHRTGRLLGVGWGELIVGAWSRPVAVTGVAAVVLFACRHWDRSFVELAVVALVGFAIYACLAAIFVLDSRDREACGVLLHRWSALVRVRENGTAA